MRRTLRAEALDYLLTQPITAATSLVLAALDAWDIADQQTHPALYATWVAEAHHLYLAALERRDTPCQRRPT